MKRIKKEYLKMLVERINEATGSPEATFTQTEDGRFFANIGNYHLSGAYGGVNLVRICNDGGGVENVFGHGHIPKRRLYDEMRAFLAGIQAGREGCNNE